MNIKNEIMSREEYIGLRKKYEDKHKSETKFWIIVLIVWIGIVILNMNMFTGKISLMEICILFGITAMALFAIYITARPLWKVDGFFGIGIVEEIYTLPIIKNGEIKNSSYAYGVRVDGKLLLSDSLDNEKQLFNPGDEVYIFNFRDESRYCFPVNAELGE